MKTLSVLFVLALSAGCAPRVSVEERNAARWEANRPQYEANRACNRVLPGESFAHALSRVNSSPKVCK